MIMKTQAALTQVIDQVIDRFAKHPVRETLKLKMRPEFSFNENDADDVMFQLVAQLHFMKQENQLERLKTAEKSLEILFDIFNDIAAIAASDENANKAEQEKGLQTLKKLIHAVARLEKHNTKEDEQQKIINLKKVFLRYEENLAKLTELEKYAELLVLAGYIEKEDKKKSFKDVELTERARAKLYFTEQVKLLNFVCTEFQRLKKQLAQDNAVLSLYDYTNDKEENKKKQKYAAIKTSIEPICDEPARINRKTVKSRINKFSLAVSLIVGVGEGLIAAVFIMGTLPFLPALLVIGIPAGICNYFLFRNDSFSVLKEIWFGKSTDTPRTKIMKAFSTLFSAGAGAAYGFLSFGSATIGIGHLFFGLSAAAAMAAPPVGLIVIAAIVAVVTAIALTTLYDYMIRKWIDEGIIDDLKKTKNNIIDFFKKPNLENKTWKDLTPAETCKQVAKKAAQLLFLAVVAAACVTISVVTLGLFSHKAIMIFHKSFGIATAIADKCAVGLSIMGAAVNSLFYSRGVVRALNVVKNVVTAPVKLYNAAKDKWTDFKKSNTMQKVETIFNGIARFLLFGCVFANSVMGQGLGMGKSHTAQAIVKNDLFQNTVSQSAAQDFISVIGSMGSGGPNGIAVVKATQSVTPISNSQNPHTLFASNTGKTTVLQNNENSHQGTSPNSTQVFH